jgi:hypothetical protein
MGIAMHDDTEATFYGIVAASYKQGEAPKYYGPGDPTWRTSPDLPAIEAEPVSQMPYQMQMWADNERFDPFGQSELFGRADAGAVCPMDGCRFSANPCPCGAKHCGFHD